MPHAFDPFLDDTQLMRLLCAQTGAREVRKGAQVAQLWSGYGEVRRFHLTGADVPSVIVKRVAPPPRPRHSRGWATLRSHQRKLRSYAVESCFYEGFAPRCGARCRVPRALHVARQDERWLFVLEDLDAAGYPGRRSELDSTQLRACLEWLAHLHATFLGSDVEGVWPEGTYWHLETRPDELEIMDHARLRAAAPELDRRLREARFRTVVHGDAKVANFCFAPGGPVAAVDFQYPGGGVGVKDVVYFFSSCLDSEACAARAEGLLDVYFESLRAAVAALHPEVDVAALEAEWRDLYAFAWADFTRFLLGWAPEHAKLHAYSLGVSGRALAQLEQGAPHEG